MVQQAPLVLKVPRGSTVLPARLDPTGPPEQRVRKVPLVLTVLQVPPVHKGQQGPMVLLERQGRMVLQEQLAHRVHPE
jgi:hypothetical protein